MSGGIEVSGSELAAVTIKDLGRLSCGARGVAVFGPAGSGKTTAALAIRRAAANAWRTRGAGASRGRPVRAQKLAAPGYNLLRVSGPQFVGAAAADPPDAFEASTEELKNARYGELTGREVLVAACDGVRAADPEFFARALLRRGAAAHRNTTSPVLTVVDDLRFADEARVFAREGGWIFVRAPFGDGDGTEVLDEDAIVAAVLEEDPDAVVCRLID